MSEGRPDYRRLPEPIDLADTVEEQDATPSGDGPQPPFDDEFRVVVLGAAG